tara:strand:+ start:26 stop:334 length:309 start_codon:yes stop_codon:yes gene_type:complete
MIKTVNISIYFLLLILLNSCGSVSDVGKVLRNEKTRTTDEFFVKKREPLSLPPDYKTLPEPNTQKKNSEETIDKIFKIPKDQSSPKSKSTSVEQSIINEIRK